MLAERLQLPLDLPVPAVSGASAEQAAALEEPDPVTFTDEQREAVARRNGPLALSAAAGSGKTSVLVERFIAAVREDGLTPAQILALTFTDRAAAELRERVRARLLELGERSGARDTEAAFVGTFHGFCARLLGAHPLAAGVTPGFDVLDEGIAANLRERAFAAALGGFVGGERPDAVSLAAAYGPERLRAIVEGVHARLRSRGQRLPRLPVPAGAGYEGLDAEGAAACALLDQLLVGFTDAYERIKRERHALDFDDLELLAGELLASDGRVRLEWSRRFELLMVDEFQDTNRRQLEILRALERDNLFTVGDEFQAIYGFRHAEVALFRARAVELAPAGASIALTRNFRSRRALVEGVGAVFERRLEGFERARAEREDDPAAAGPATELLLVAKGGWDDAGASARALAEGLPRAATWRQAEARLLARRVAGLVAAGEARAGDIVVLLRALGDLAVYERALAQQGLATIASAGAFWESPEVEDLIAYLRMLANPLDELALYSTLASPLVGLSRDGLALLALAAARRSAGAFELAAAGVAELGLGPVDERALAAFCERVRNERARAPMRAISELIARALDAGGAAMAAVAERHARPDASRGLANAHKLMRLALRFEAAEGRDLRAFLDHVAMLKQRGRGGEADAPVLDAEADAVRLMSIHAAKGLEFEVVCVADLGRAPYTRAPDLLVEGRRIGLQLVRLDGEGGQPTLDYAQLSEERRDEEAREEDRIMYVAMTRARERLLLSGAIDLERRPCEGANGSVMSWLAPALVGDLDEFRRAAEPAETEPLILEAAGGAGLLRCELVTPATAGALALPENTASTPPGAAVQEASASPVAAAPATAAPAAAVRARGAAGSARAEAVHPQQLAMELTGFQPTPSGAGHGIETLSYSSLRELERCGYRYYLERVLGLPEQRGAARPPVGTASSTDARARGTLVHQVLETFDFARAPEATGERVGQLARQLGMHLSGDERREIASMIDAAAGAAAGRRIAAAQELWREHPFTFPASVGGPLITGVIDLLAREGDGGFLVVDYKSDPVAADEDLEVLVEREYGLQRELYALAVLRSGAGSVEVLHWFLRRPAEPVAARFTTAERERLQSALSRRIERALRYGFAVSRRPHRALCLTCPGRTRLCSWPENATMREDPQPGADAR